MTRIEELTGQFPQVNVHDDKALLSWLKDMFEACEDAGIELPGRNQIASKIGRARRMLPDPMLSDNPPQGDKTHWVLTLSINTLITNDTPERLADLYGITALAIESWLLEHRQ